MATENIILQTAASAGVSTDSNSGIIGSALETTSRDSAMATEPIVIF